MHTDVWPPWLFPLIGVAFILATVVVRAKVRAFNARPNLQARFRNRTPASALAACQAALPGFEGMRVEQAYRWVQELVPYHEPPLHPSDLLESISIGRRAIELKLQSSEILLNPDPTELGPVEVHSLQTVGELMTEVLRRGLEAAPDIGARA